MRYQVTWLIGAILVVLGLVNLTVALDPENPDPLTVVSNGMSQFTTEFYKISSGNEANNLICSPTSAGIALSMAAYGARGNTEKQMKSGLHLPENDAVGKGGYQSLIDTLNDLKSVMLRLAQKIYIADSFEIHSEFKDMTDNNFRSPIEALDFNKADKASQTINGWCAQKTNNRIREIVSADDVRGASIVLVNAIYFKGIWNVEFDEELTGSQPFHIDEKTTNDVKMMLSRDTHNYGTLPDLDAVFVELPYKKLNDIDSISMFIILPNTITGLKKAEESLDKVNLKEKHDNPKMTLINLSLPKFKIESTLELQPTLEKLGMTDMFQDTADFTGITAAPPLKVTKVIQKAFIEIDEKGSEAAAATAVIGMARSEDSLSPEPVTVTVDRPFYYAIVHPATNTVLFQGHITDPKYDENELCTQRTLFIRRIILLSITWIVGAILIASNCFTYTIAAVVPENEEALKTVSDGIKHFASNFYKTSSDGESDNLICSPLSADIVLSMASYGAGGNTKAQMRSTLHIPENDEVGKRGFQSLIDNLNNLKKVELRLAQKIFMQNGIEIKPDFKDITENYFRSTAQTLDFSKAEEASQTINNWCSEKTNNRIKEVIKAGDIKDASMVLVNAVYFKGNWNSPFEGYNTSPRPFRVDESTIKDVDMMYQHHSFNYGNLPDLDAIFVELPYESENENDAISMFIIVPNRVTGLEKLEESLYQLNFKEFHDQENMLLMHLEVPKFKIESTLQLQTVLEKLGMTDMFNDTADFKGITDNPPLKISKVVQKAFIEVNEKGSEAAAVTAVVAVPMSLPMHLIKPIRINVDRPFAYVIHHTATNTILFQGHITLPKM
ncbi:uncharacterized protein LOC130663228 [Microplitis mediator]|uniref:uncharacterized protein LOC130663228 n=1 Tax=Microplitis mediator TaxID=375433 RepID=UPI002557A16A|nr:uncharacterized protein LOC130663228 [Microplitis mediator]